MVASKARKERRQQSFDVHHLDESNPTKKPKTKFGRKEKRTITRHTRRHNNDVADDEEEEDEEEEKQESEQDSDNSDAEHGDSNANRKAYDSLLTLLKHDHKEEKKLKSSAPDIDQEIEEDEEQEEEIAGELDVEEDDDEEEIVEELSSDEESDNDSDPFNSHFNNDDEIDLKIDKVQSLMKEIKSKKTSKRRLKLVNKLKTDSYTILENTPDIEDVRSISKLHFNPHQYHIKAKLVPTLESKNLSSLEKCLCNSMFQYQNVNLQYYDDEELEDSYQDLYLLHVLNHIFKTRDRILKNNNKKLTILESIAKGTMKPEDEPEFRDQGYTRPKILIMLPTRNFAYDIVTKLIELAAMDSVENKSRFNKQFYDDFKFDSKSKKSKQFKKFFKGNTNDFFCLGIKMTRKTLKLYSSFDTSDILIASPIGLKMILEKKPTGKKTNDFLSSIEMLILDKSHGLLMQNWDHVSSILEKLNLPPKAFNDSVDFSRVRMWSINDNAKYLTQFLNFTRFGTPELNNLTNLKSMNLQGSLTIKPLINEQSATINKITKNLTLQGILNNETKLRQVFQRFDVDSILDEPNLRFKYFINVTLSQILNKSSYKNGVLIYIPSYMDYLRLTNYFKTNSKFEILNIDEYSSQSKLTRSRYLFEHELQKYKIMLYTERLHFYKNYDLKGVKNLIFYSLPTDPQFYQDCINFLIKSKLKNDLIVNGILESEEDDENFDLNLAMVRVLFSKIDLIKLEKIVGLSKLNLLCNGPNEMFEFR